MVNIFRKMLLDASVIDKEDAYIMDHIKAFAEDTAIDTPAAKQLIVLVDRIVRSCFAVRFDIRLIIQPTAKVWRVSSSQVHARDTTQRATVYPSQSRQTSQVA